MRLRKLIRLQFLVVAVIVGIGVTAIANATRTSGGTYSLPVNTNNPAITGQPIDAADHNATMNDLATEMTDSLSRSNKGAMLGPLQLQAGAGSATTPTLTWSGDTNTGFYWISANRFGMAVNGLIAAEFLPDVFLFYNAAGTNMFGCTVTGGYCVSPLPMLLTGSATVSAASDATGGTRQTALTIPNGDIDFSGVTYPTSTTGHTDKIGPANFAKVWATISFTNATPFVPSVVSGFNVASVSRVDAQTVRVTIADDMANANYAVMGAVGGVVFQHISVVATATTHFDVRYSTGAAHTTLDSAGGGTFYVMVMGAQ